MIPWKPLGKYSLRGKKKKKRATYSDLKFLIVHFLEILCYLMIKFIYSDQGSHSFESLAKVLKFWRTFIGLEKVWKKFDLACLGLEKVWNLSESKNYQPPPKKKPNKQNFEAQNHRQTLTLETDWHRSETTMDWSAVSRWHFHIAWKSVLSAIVYGLDGCMWKV